MKYFPNGTLVKNLPTSAGDIGDSSLIPGLGRSPGGGNGNPLQYSCLEKSMDRGAWWAATYGVTKSWTWLNMYRHTHSVFSLGIITYPSNFTLKNASSLKASPGTITFIPTIFTLLFVSKFITILVNLLFNALPSSFFPRHCVSSYSTNPVFHLFRDLQCPGHWWPLMQSRHLVKCWLKKYLTKMIRQILPNAREIWLRTLNRKKGAGPSLPWDEPTTSVGQEVVCRTCKPPKVVISKALCVCVHTCSVVSDSLQPYGL